MGINNANPLAVATLGLMNSVEGGGVTVPPPVELGVVSASPFAQGCVKVRFYEMVPQGGSVAYRYDFHVKRLADGVLTKTDIDDGTYYSCSFYQGQINPDLEAGSPFSPGIAEVVLAVESSGDAGDNKHLFTNQEYQIAVRAIAILGSTIAEDDNEAVCVVMSSGYQGIHTVDIGSIPALVFRDPIDLSNVRITSMPALIAAISSLPALTLQENTEVDVNLKKAPNLNIRVNRGGQ